MHNRFHFIRSGKLFAVALLLGALAFQGFAAAPLVIPLWPEGVPGFKADAPAETVIEGRFTNVHHATLTMYAPPVEKSTGAAFIVAPGGGYVRVTDGKGDARRLNDLGITVFVLKYRLNTYGHPAPLQDMLRAVRMVRSRAVEFGIRADRIGVLGGSAGGHLSACAATLWDSPLGKTGHALDEVSARPNLAALIYPVVTMEDPFVHKGSRRALLGENSTPQQIQLLSLEKQVRSNSPPFFIVATMADQSVPVENSLQLYQALRNVGVPAELHAYSVGSHGNSLDPQYGPTAKWPDRLEEWLRFHKWIATDYPNFARWEKEIAGLEASATTNPPPKNGILFLGSSTIRLWKSLEQDFPGLPIVSRGFGGSEIADATHFADRLVFPHAPKQIIFRSGGNDLQTGKTPEEVVADFKAFVATVHARLPETEIVFMAWNNSPSRWSSAARENALNRLIAEYAQSQPRVKFLDVADVLRDAKGEPRPELFVGDRLHFNAEGYRLLAERVRPVLLK
jgi:acetyl esterase/lipase/lysophospholipase L1-like esterase